jgi:peptidoglycan/xylan/chitin deacetylase (PgdA/CDA1 family)
MPGIFTLSLDLELRWGTRDKLSLEQYQANILGAHRAVPAILKLFERYQIAATWATVGFLFCRNKSELLGRIPRLQPSYTDPRLSPYADFDKLGNDERDDPLHFGASLIDRIADSPCQELATHTLSHYYCLEPGQTQDEFAQDLQVALQLARDHHQRDLKTIVFPRNQVNPEYFGICQQLGLRVYRGNEEAWFYEARNDARVTLPIRLMRFSDTFVNVSGAHAHNLRVHKGLVNVPSSRFLRPYNPHLRALDPLRLRRIRRSMEEAAREGQVYHLWWHPENFGVNLEQNLAFLEEVLVIYKRLEGRLGMQNLTMLEAAQTAAQSQPVPAKDPRTLPNLAVLSLIAADAVLKNGLPEHLL